MYSVFAATAAAALRAAAAALVSAREAFSRAMEASRSVWRALRGRCARLQGQQQQQSTIAAEDWHCCDWQLATAQAHHALQ
jgi:hypothetical protein